MKWMGSALRIRHPRARGRALIFSLCLVLAACSPSGGEIRSPRGTLTPDRDREGPGEVAFIGGDGNLYTWNLLDAQPRTLTDDAGPRPDGSLRVYEELVWAPAGDRLAFIGLTRSAAGETTGSLFIVDANGEGKAEVYASEHEVPFYVYWAPDGERLSFLTTSADGDGLHLKLVSVSGGGARRLDTGQPYYWDWSPQGDALVVHVGAAPDGRLEFLTPAETVRLHPVPLEPALFQAPAWSPGGDTAVLAIRDAEGAPALALVDREGAIVRSLTRLQGAVAYSLSPDGERLAYIAGQRHAGLGLLGPLRVISIETGAVLASTEDALVYAFFWAPDGERVAYFAPSLVSPELESQEIVQQDDPGLRFGLHVLEASDGETRRLLVFEPTPSLLSVLPFHDQYQRSTTIWSPDSRSLIVPVVEEDGEANLWVVDVEESEAPRVLGPGVLGFWSRR